MIVAPPDHCFSSSRFSFFLCFLRLLWLKFLSAPVIHYEYRRCRLGTFSGDGNSSFSV